MSALLRTLLQRVEAGGRLDHAGQQRGFVKVQIGRLFAEIVSCSSVKADDLASAELDLIEIGGKQFLLSDSAVELPGVPDLGSLPFQFGEHVATLEIVKHQVLQELHRYGAAAPAQAASQNRTQSYEVHPAMVHE